MKKISNILTLIVTILLTVVTAYTQEKKEIHKEFDGKKAVKIKTVSGACEVKTHSSNKILVHLVYSVEPPGAFEPEFKETERYLKLSENWSGSSSSGTVNWTLTLPAKTEISFSTASGDFLAEGTSSPIEVSTASGEISVTNAKGEFKISTASGDVTLEDGEGEFDISTASGDVQARNIKGDIEMSTASGEIDINNSRGVFELSCASGDIDVSGIIIEEESSFSTASGTVDVRVSSSPEYDLNLSSASGDVTLDYSGNPIKGYFEVSARKDRGRITSPIKFDNESEFERNDHTYVKKSFTRESETPKIYIETSTGKVVLKK